MTTAAAVGVACAQRSATAGGEAAQAMAVGPGAVAAAALVRSHPLLDVDLGSDASDGERPRPRGGGLEAEAGGWPFGQNFLGVEGGGLRDVSRP